MRIILFVSFLCFQLNLNSQNLESETPCAERSFENQGQQEDCWSEKFFEKEYSETNFDKFLGDIAMINETTIKFENKTLLVWGTEKSLNSIFLQGIFYPHLLTGYNKTEKRKIKIKSSSTANQKLFAKLSQKSDTLRISNFEELTFLNTSPQVKRFRFWLYLPGRLNPQVYFIELKNRNAMTNMNFNDFIAGSRLTFLKGAWIII